MKKRMRKKSEQKIILFADIRGFSRGLSENPPSKMIDFIYDFYTIGRKAIHNYEFAKYAGGDEILACFTDANYAVESALLLRQNLTPALMKYGLDVGIGVHKDEVCILDTHDGDFGVIHIGLAYNIAKRLEQTSYGGDITISEVLFNELKREFQDKFTVKQEMKLRGWGWPVKVRISIR
jgi:class 3 adenylate cyclase